MRVNIDKVPTERGQDVAVPLYMINVRCGSAEGSYALFHRPSVQYSFEAWSKAEGKAPPILAAKSETMRGLRTKLRKHVGNHFAPKRTEHIIRFDCQGIWHLDVEVVGPNTLERRERTVNVTTSRYYRQSEKETEWREGRNPWRSGYTDEVNEVPFTEERWRKAIAFWLIKEHLSYRTGNNITSYLAKLVRTKKRGRLTLDPVKFDALDMKAAVNAFMANSTKDMLTKVNDALAGKIPTQKDMEDY